MTHATMGWSANTGWSEQVNSYGTVVAGSLRPSGRRELRHSQVSTENEDTFFFFGEIPRNDSLFFNISPCKWEHASCRYVHQGYATSPRLSVPASQFFSHTPSLYRVSPPLPGYSRNPPLAKSMGECSKFWRGSRAKTHGVYSTSEDKQPAEGLKWIYQVIHQILLLTYSTPQVRKCVIIADTVAVTSSVVGTRS
jgi:hypothetical protein